MNVHQIAACVSCLPNDDGKCQFCGEPVQPHDWRSAPFVPRAPFARVQRCPNRKVPDWIPAYIAEQLEPSHPARLPRPSQPAPAAETAFGLGDAVESVLSGIGLTKERYIQVKRLFGFPPTCDCEARKEWLNNVGRWWGGIRARQ